MQKSEEQEERDARTSAIIDALENDTPLPSELKRSLKDLPSPAELEAELASHPFFMKEAPAPGEPLHPLVEAIQQLKYSEDENTPEELAKTYKEDGLWHFKLGKYRIAASIFTEGIKHGEKCEDKEILANLYNNRGVCQFYVGNFGSALKDFTKAIELKPNYDKSYRKGVESCIQLGKFSKGLELIAMAKKMGIVEGWEGTENVLKVGEKRSKLSAHRVAVATKEKKRTSDILLHRIKSSGIKLSNENFLLENDDAKVTIGEDDELKWPVLFYYPEFSQSDFIKEFAEKDCFLDHLHEMLDVDPPGWDKNNEYRSDKVTIHFVDPNKGGWLKIESHECLGEVLRKERYTLPSNGVPGFFILAQNEFCKFFIERME